MVSRSPLWLPAGAAVGGGAAAVAAGGDGDGPRHGRRGRQRGQGKNEGGKRGAKAGAAPGQGAAVASATPDSSLGGGGGLTNTPSLAAFRGTASLGIRPIRRVCSATSSIVKD